MTTEKTINNTTKIPRLRSLKKCVEEIQKLDPGSEITYWVLRRWVLEGYISARYNGCKALVDVDEVIAYMQTDHDGAA